MFKQKNISTGMIFYSDKIPELEHFFTTRETVLKSNEVGIDTSKNIDAVCEYLNIAREDLISPTQTHSTNVDFTDEKKRDYPETDSLILTNKKQAIYLNFADCVPVILYDKKLNTGAIAHAGWRGTAGRIVVKTVNKMIEYSNSSVKDIYAVIGAAISDCCYEVGDDVVEAIKNSVDDYSDLVVFRENRAFVNLKKTNARQLVEMGVPVENIDVCPFCTSCRSDLFYSYRKENGTTNRHSAVIKLR